MFEKIHLVLLSKGTIDRQPSSNESLFKQLKYSYHYSDKEQFL